MNLDDGTSIRFNQFSGGLYYYATINMENKNTENQVTIFLSTVKSNKLYFHKHKIEGAGAAIIQQQLEGWP